MAFIRIRLVRDIFACVCIDLRRKVPFASDTICRETPLLMVHYELAVIFRTLGKTELPAAGAWRMRTLLAQGSIVRGVESRGDRRLPYKMGAHKERFTHGRYCQPEVFNISFVNLD